MRRPFIECGPFLGLVFVTVVSADQFGRNVIKDCLSNVWLYTELTQAGANGAARIVNRPRFFQLHDFVEIIFGFRPAREAARPRAAKRPRIETNTTQIAAGIRSQRRSDDYVAASVMMVADRARRGLFIRGRRNLTKWNGASR